MSPWLALAIGIILGGGLGAGITSALFLRHRLRRQAELDDARLALARAEARVEALETQIGAAEETEQRLRDTFDAVGVRALDQNNERFLELAKQSFERWTTQAAGEVDQRRVAIETLVAPIRELLNRQNEAVGVLERHRAVTFRGLEEQIRAVARSHESLSTETRRLVTALRRPEQRGRWGEMQLRNVVELAGMTKHCDFTEQPQTDDPESRQRPDMLVHLPGGGVVVIDAKVAIDAYLDALQPDADQAALLRRHTQQVRSHVTKLAAKAYWNQFDRTPTFVVLFMPLESALAAALEIEPDLHERAMAAQVVIATPTLLVALLRTVATGWRAEDVAANADAIAKAGKDLYDRLEIFVQHFERVGERLRMTGEAYNRAVGSLEQRLMPGARKLRELHATSRDEIATPARLDNAIRETALTELKPTPPSVEIPEPGR